MTQTFLIRNKNSIPVRRGDFDGRGDFDSLCAMIIIVVHCKATVIFGKGH